MKILTIGFTLALLVIFSSCGEDTAPSVPSPAPAAAPEQEAVTLKPWQIPVSSNTSSIVSIVRSGEPVIATQSVWLMGGRASFFYLYADGNIIFVEEERLRMSSPEYPSFRTWKTGKLQAVELNELLDFVEESGFEDLKSNYVFEGKTNNGGKTMGDMGYTVTIKLENSRKTSSTMGYLTPDRDLTYPDMPYPLNELYARLKSIADARTIEVATEDIDLKD